MKRWQLGCLGLVCGALLPAMCWASDWPQFRGYRASGVLTEVAVPTSWDLESGSHVLWQVDIPGLGHAAPIIWGDRVYVATALTDGEQSLKTGLYGDIEAAEDMGKQQWKLLAIDKGSGEVIYDRTVHEGTPSIKRHTKATHCNSTPAIDGNSIVAILASEGLFCFDSEGQLRWKRDLGPMDSGYFQVKTAQWGFASSPVIHNGKVVVQCDVQEGSFLGLYDLEDGKEIWKTPRSDVPTWSTPTIVEHGGRTQILVNGWKHTGAYDFETGEEIWKLTGGGDIPVPTPVTAHGLAYFSSAHGKFRPIRAVRLGATGDITPKEIADRSEDIPWVHPRRGAYMGTPVVVGNHLFSCDSVGVLACFDARTGEIRYRERLGSGGGGFTASMVSDGKHLFIPGETGKVFVVKADGEFSVVAQNQLNDACLASPALSQGMIVFRTQQQLIAVGSPNQLQSGKNGSRF